MNVAKVWIDSHPGDLAAVNVLRALLAKHAGDEGVCEFVAQRALSIAQNSGGVRVRRLLGMSMMNLPAHHPLTDEIVSLLGHLRI